MEQYEISEKNSSRNTTPFNSYNFNFDIFQYNQSSIRFMGWIRYFYYNSDDKR